ncbi:hypothetical protein K504DRAFT_411853, partial [Pleomassaria siparia CBS 279.74]
MSSGFVSAGVIEIERDTEWKNAQSELEEKRRLKAAEQEKFGASGQSLFEVLQANKVAKEEAFIEANRYKLHGLNDEELEHIESLEAAKRKEEETIRRDTLQQLDSFRRQQEAAEQKALEDGPQATEDAQWIATGRKRKKGPETGLLKGVKVKKAAVSVEDKAKGKENAQTDNQAKSTAGASPVTAPQTRSNAATKTTAVTVTKPVVISSNPLSLTLGYESSDED